MVLHSFLNRKKSGVFSGVFSEKDYFSNLIPTNFTLSNLNNLFTSVKLNACSFIFVLNQLKNKSAVHAGHAYSTAPTPHFI